VNVLLLLGGGGGGGGGPAGRLQRYPLSPRRQRATAYVPAAAAKPFAVASPPPHHSKTDADAAPPAPVGFCFPAVGPLTVNRIPKDRTTVAAAPMTVFQ